MQMTWTDFEKMAKDFIATRGLQPPEARRTHEREQLGKLLVQAYQAGMRAQRRQTIRYLELSDSMASLKPGARAHERRSESR